MTIKFLRLHTKDVNGNEIVENLQFPDWQCVYSLCEDIEHYLNENHSLHDEYKGHKFDLDREGFIQIVKMIPYILIEKNHACPCCKYLQIVISNILKLQYLLITLHVITELVILLIILNLLIIYQFSYIRK